MAAKNPRVQVSLSPATYELIKRLSDVTGESMSAIIGGIVEPSSATLVRLCSFMERAAAAPDEYKAGVAEDFERAYQRMEKMAGDMEHLLSGLDSQPPYL